MSKPVQTETPTLQILPYFYGNSPLNTEYGPVHMENDPTKNYLLTSPLIEIQWHPESYFAPNSPPAATSARTKSIICMGVGLHLQGEAAHAL